MLRIKEAAPRGIAVATDGNGVKTYLDPFAGGAMAVAEACRNVACSGARPVAITDCLNFGNPERLDVYFQLEECVRGMAAACETLGVPVVSGNVSLFNESDGDGDLPDAGRRRARRAGRRVEGGADRAFRAPATSST